MPMPWSLIILILLAFGLFPDTGAAPEEDLPSARVVGTVLCAPCFNRGFSRSSHFIPGASVLVECTELGFRKEVTTGKGGKFEVCLPPSTSEDAKEMQGCMVKLIRSSDPACDAVSSRASLRLKLNRQGAQVLSVGVLAFTPREQPSLCIGKPTRRGCIESSSRKGSVNPETARRASKTSDYPPRAITVSEPTTAPVASPPVLGSTTLPLYFHLPFPLLSPLQPLPPFHFPPLPEVTPPPPSTFIPFPPLPQPPTPSPSPSFHIPLPTLPPHPPVLLFPLPPLLGFTPPPPILPLPPFRYPPTPAVAPPPPSISFRFPPLPQPPIPSPSSRPASPSLSPFSLSPSPNHHNHPRCRFPCHHSRDRCRCCLLRPLYYTIHIVNISYPSFSITFFFSKRNYS